MTKKWQQPSLFTTKEVADYYNTTQNHYLKWWNLKNSLSLHHGIWDKNTKNFAESLVNTNRVMMELAGITKSDKVLDAGCGVGGASLFINNKVGATVTGITLSTKQVDFAEAQIKKRKLEDKISFSIMDYTHTTFADNSFDVIWACESISSAPNKAAFIKEASRLLKKGGRLIMSDFFKNSETQEDNHKWMKKWGATWSISNFVSANYFANELANNSFLVYKNADFTSSIIKSAKRIYYAALLGSIPSIFYNLTHPKVSRFAKTHYLSGYYQYKAIKAGLWQYRIMLAIKV